jgi:hypothetical protein
VAHWGDRETPCDACNLAQYRYAKARKLERHETGQRRRVSSLGYRRRIEALQAIGWNLREITDALGIRNVGTLTTRLYRSEWVSRENHAHMAEVYERLCMTPKNGPASSRTLRHAERRGYAPPLAWDDIDDPDEQPHRGAQRTYRGGELLLAEYDHLIRGGIGHEEAIARLEVTPGAIEQARHRHKREAA